MTDRGQAEAASEPTRVLIVDDLPNTREWWVLFLGHHGFVTRAVGTLYDALRELRRDKYDAVVADLHLAGPGRADGGDLLTAVARWHPSVKARILMTADRGLGAPMAESIGADFFDKDLDPVELVMLIRSMVARA